MDKSRQVARLLGLLEGVMEVIKHTFSGCVYAISGAPVALDV